MGQASVPLFLRAYSGRENGLMVIGTADELHRLGQQLLAVGQFPVQEGNWPAEVAHPMVVGPYRDAPDFQLSFHVRATRQCQSHCLSSVEVRMGRSRLAPSSSHLLAY